MILKYGAEKAAKEELKKAKLWLARRSNIVKDCGGREKKRKRKKNIFRLI